MYTQIFVTDGSESTIGITAREDVYRLYRRFSLFSRFKQISKAEAKTDSNAAAGLSGHFTDVIRPVTQSCCWCSIQQIIFAC